MKVGIITYHRSQNYGAQLQAYALRRSIEKLGCKSKVLDCNTIGEESMFEWHFHSIRGFVGAIKNNLLSLVSERKRNRLFKDFSTRMVGLSRPCLSKNELNNAVGKCDYIITGSDQVWHPQINEGQTCFFLDLPIKKCQKIAYAPSFGISEYTETEVSRYMPFINDIEHLSVREESGKKLIKKYINREVELVLDPTMLLTKQQWNEIAKKSKYSKYLFYFTILDEQLGTDELVRKIAKEKELQIVRIGGLKDILKKGFINARANGPQEFLGLVRDADFIVTSSFHGTVFSILFEKQFLCVLNSNNRNSRMETLTSSLGLKDCLVLNPSVYDLNAYKTIDYFSVYSSLQHLRAGSMNFLKTSINL